MRTVRVYSQSRLTADTTIVLEPDAARHVATVLRMRAGDSLLLFDDSGEEYAAEVLKVERKAVEVRVDAATGAAPESPLAVTLVHGLCRGERMDYVIQKATELGVHAIYPVLTERGVVKLDAARSMKRVDHWKKVAISAAEQCGRTRVPAIAHPQPLADYLANYLRDSQPPGTRLILDPSAARSLATAMPAGASTVTLLTGPEGGFSEDEREAAVAAGFTSVRLGPRVLRTETAPVAALCAVQLIAGDLGTPS